MQLARSATTIERSLAHGRSLLSLQRLAFPAVTARFQSSVSAAGSVSPSTAATPVRDDVTTEPASKPHFTQILPGHSKYAPDVPLSASGEPIWDNPTNHAVYDLDKIASIPLTHHQITKMHERVAFYAIKTARAGFDWVSGYRGPGGAMTERDWLHRVLFLETIAGVPGMVGGMLRHLRSLRLLRRDYGWIHTLIEEAENERMHLLIFMNLKQPGWFFRGLVLGAQGVFFNSFFLAYLVSPRTCHRFVGYLEEEAVHTYTDLLKDIEEGHLDEWKKQQAPLIGRSYYKLPEDAKIYDMIKCIRADEANHRDVNHTFADLDQKKGVSPYVFSHHH